MKYLKASKTLAIVAFPSIKTYSTHFMLVSLDENPAVVEASVYENEIPISAYFIAAFINHHKTYTIISSISNHGHMLVRLLKYRYDLRLLLWFHSSKYLGPHYDIE